MTDFGDFSADDAFDREPPDPEQVTYKLHKLRTEVAALVGAPIDTWEGLGTTGQVIAFAQGAALVDWVLGHSPDPVELARVVHEARRAQITGIQPWERLSQDEQTLGIQLMAIILAWLARQGAI